MAGQALVKPTGVRFGSRATLPKTVMPGLGPGIHELRMRRRGDRRRQSDPGSLGKPFPPQLVDARAKPWHDGGEVVCALDGYFDGVGRQAQGLA